MLVSVTVSSNREDLIGDALRSVLPFVDRCLLIDMSITDRTADIAREVCGDKLVIVKMDWHDDMDFCDARNFGLAEAAKLGATWAMTLDTDERITAHDMSELENNAFDIFLCYDIGRNYAKERFFRLPLNPGAHWIGSSHEAFVAGAGSTRSVLKNWTFKELGKTPEQYHKRFLHDVEVLTKYNKRYPDVSRWWFYLGETHMNLKEPEKAFPAYMACARTSTWDEELGWTRYRLAECQVAFKEYGLAIDQCLKGLLEHPGFAELAWLAGWCYYQVGQYRNAIYWSRMAKTIGEAEKKPELARIGFRHIPAYRDGPANVEEFAWRAMQSEI